MKKIIIITFFLFCSVTGANAQVAVIANKSVPITKIEKSQLLDLYTGDIRLWSDGEPVIVFDLKPKGEVRKTFYKFLGKSSSRMKSIWMKRMLSGEGDPPEVIKSEQEMIEKINSTPGAIGFVNQSVVSSDVKVLFSIEKNY